MEALKKALLAVLLMGGFGLLVGAGAFWWIDTGARRTGPSGDDVELEVQRGATAKTMAVMLEKNGLVRDGRFFRYAVWRRGGLALKAGKFRLSPKLSAFDLAVALEASPLAEEEAIVIVEGWRIRDVDAALVQAGRLDRGAYVQAASDANGYLAPFTLPTGTLEGYLYPETYRLPKGRIDPKVLVQKQLDQFAARVFQPLADEIQKSRRSLHELVVMASMLEREEPTPANRPLVAGILWKRIDRSFPLGVDATSRYELAEWNDRVGFLARLRDRDDRYNTRYKTGLPPTPIGAPTAVSFEAALRPEKSEFLYYLHDAQKRLHPSRNAEEHERLRKKFDVY